MSECSTHITEVLAIAKAMMQLADRREADCNHDGCLLLDGVIRDCAYKIRAAAERYRMELALEDAATAPAGPRESSEIEWSDLAGPGNGTHRTVTGQER